MFDKDSFKDITGIKVSQLIQLLQDEYPQDAVIECCGDDYVFLHKEEDNSIVSIDCEPLDECYPEDMDVDDDKYKFVGNKSFQCVLEDLDTEIKVGGIILPNGDIICSCCGGIISSNNIYADSEIENLPISLSKKYTCDKNNADFQLMKVILWNDVSSDIIKE